MNIAGIELNISEYSGHYITTGLSNAQLSAIYNKLASQYGVDRWDTLINCDDDLINDLFETCEKYKDFKPDYNGGEMHYKWMDQMRGQRPVKF